MKIKLFRLACFSALFLSSYMAGAQQVSSHKPWTKEDSVAINALVMYPENIRLEIFEACEYPAAIVNIASLQKNTSTAFANAVSPYPKDVQDEVWNLTRYPGLINQLVSGGRKSPEQLEAMLSAYPDEVHESAKKYGREYYELMQTINDQLAQSNTQFAQIIEDLPSSAQQDFTDLVKLPEVMNLLNDHLSLAVRVGDHYKRDPQRVIQRADSLNLAEARQNAQDAETWKQTVQQDPDAQAELKSAANDYAQENGYTQQEAMAPVNAAVIENYTSYPYSYWVGYPTWYTAPYWYPHPMWFDWGFYYDPFGNMVFFGTPSFYFVNWYFYYPEHCARYPHLGGCYVHHYYEHRSVYNGNRLIVHNWVQDNRQYLPKDFITNRDTRIGAIKEVGQLNTEVRRQTNGNVSPEARDRYFKANVNKYPTLKATSQQPRVEQESGLRDVREEPVKQQTAPSHRNVFTPRSQSEPKAPVPAQPTQRVYDYNKVNQGQNYHRNTWEQAQPTNRAPVERTQPSYRAPSPAPRSAPPSPPRSAPQSAPMPRSSGGGRK